MKQRTFLTDSAGKLIKKGAWLKRLNNDGSLIEYGHVEYAESASFLVRQYNLKGEEINLMPLEKYVKSRWKCYVTAKPETGIRIEVHVFTEGIGNHVPCRYFSESDEERARDYYTDMLLKYPDCEVTMERVDKGQGYGE